MEPRHRSLDAASNSNNPQNAPATSPLDTKYHRERGPWFTSSNVTYLSLKGFVDGLLCSALLASAGLLLENMNRCGFRVSLTNWMHLAGARHSIDGFYPSLILFLYMPVHLVVALIVEKAIAQAQVPEDVGCAVHGVNLMCQFVYPILGIWTAGDAISVVGGAVVCSFNTVAVLKLWSFIHTCLWAREKRRQVQTGVDGASNESNDSNITVYPANVSVANLAYFMSVPTLCYELDFPRRATTNWKSAAISAAMLVAAVTLKLSVIDQWVVPCMWSMVGPIERNEWAVFAAQLLKVAIPLYLVFLLFGFILLHANITLWSELTRFADSHAYDDWWEAEDVSQFWRRWNLPVHKWCSRHLYKPLRRQGYSKTTAKWFTFLFSGVMHEYVSSVSLRMFGVYFTVLMLAQVPLCDLTEWLRRKAGPRWGRTICVVNRVVILPLCFFLIVHDYQLAYNGSAGLAAFENFSVPS